MTDMTPEPSPTEPDPAGVNLEACQGSVLELHQYIDGHLSGQARDEVRAHIDRCETCEDVYRFHAELQNLIGSTCRTELPDELRSRIINALIDQPE